METTWLSLFDGMSCLQIAAKELGISPQRYYAREIDQHAIKQTQLNFPETIQLGTVTEWRTWDIDWAKVDLIGAGSPCQGFSFAGKQLAFDDLRSKLFFVFIDILNHCKKFNPNVKFLLENVDMKREHMKVINDFTGVFGQNINSNLVSAQNRSRWYWSNIKTKQVGLFSETHTDIPKPKDRGILLKDILENEVPEKYYLSDKIIEGFSNKKEQWSKCFKPHNFDTKKSYTITSRIHKCSASDPYIKVDKSLRPKPDQLKASTLTCGGNSGGNHSDMDLICVSMRGRGEGWKQQLEPNNTCKSNTLTSVQKDNLVFREQRIRRLTPTECARLQTIPNWYKWGCSDTQQYRMLGNGWTVEVIKHILSFLK